jgi:hypothetical protein
MTLQEAKSIAHGNEATAYYTDSLEDGVNTAVEMARNVMQVIDETIATGPAPSRLKALSDDELWQVYEAHVWRPRDRQLDALHEAILAEIDRRAELSPQNPA